MTLPEGEPTPSEQGETRPGFVAVGQVLSPWGLRGDLKVQPLVDHPDRLRPGRSLYLAGQRRLIERCRWQKGYAFLKLSGIDDRNAVEGLRSRYLEVPEADLLPLGESQYYHFQLIGLGVRSSQGFPLGKVTRIRPGGQAGADVFVVHGMLGEVLIPAVDDIVKEIDLKENVMVIEVVPGLLPEGRRRQ